MQHARPLIALMTSLMTADYTAANNWPESWLRQRWWLKAALSKTRHV